MMNCQQFAARVTDYLERRLGFSDRVRARVHLLACSVCRAYTRQMRETKIALSSLAPPSTSPELDAAMRSAFQDFKRGRGQ